MVSCRVHTDLSDRLLPHERSAARQPPSARAQLPQPSTDKQAHRRGDERAIDMMSCRCAGRCRVRAESASCHPSVRPLGRSDVAPSARVRHRAMPPEVAITCSIVHYHNNRTADECVCRQDSAPRQHSLFSLGPYFERIKALGSVSIHL